MSRHIQTKHPDVDESELQEHGIKKGRDKVEGTKRKRRGVARDDSIGPAAPAGYAPAQAAAPSPQTTQDAKGLFDINRHYTNAGAEDSGRATKKLHRSNEADDLHARQVLRFPNPGTGYNPEYGTIDPALLAADRLFDPFAQTTTTADSFNAAPVQLANDQAGPGAGNQQRQSTPHAPPLTNYDFRHRDGDGYLGMSDAEFDQYLADALRDA